MAMIDFERDTDPAERREHERTATLLPTLEFGSESVRLIDFSERGFRAVLPRAFRAPGATGEAVLCVNAAGYTVRKRVAFQVVHIIGDAAGCRFDILGTDLAHTGLSC